MCCGGRRKEVGKVRKFGGFKDGCPSECLRKVIGDEECVKIHNPASEVCLHSWTAFTLH